MWSLWGVKKQSVNALLSTLGQHWSSALISCRCISNPGTVSMGILSVWVSPLLTVRYNVPDAKWMEVKGSVDFNSVGY